MGHLHSMAGTRQVCDRCGHWWDDLSVEAAEYFGRRGGPGGRFRTEHDPIREKQILDYGIDARDFFLRLINNGK